MWQKKELCLKKKNGSSYGFYELKEEGSNRRKVSEETTEEEMVCTFVGSRGDHMRSRSLRVVESLEINVGYVPTVSLK